MQFEKWKSNLKKILDQSWNSNSLYDKKTISIDDRDVCFLSLLGGLQERTKLFFSPRDQLEESISFGVLEKLDRYPMSTEEIEEIHKRIKIVGHCFWGLFFFNPKEKTKGIFEGDSNFFFFLPRFIFEKKEEKIYFSIFHKKEETKKELEKIIDALEYQYPENNKTTYLGKEKDSYSEIEKKIEKAVEEIKRGKLDKVVLASCVHYELPKNTHYKYIQEVAKKNRNSYKAIMFVGGKWVFSFSPERLLKLEGVKIKTEALAGTISSKSDALFLKEEKIKIENKYVLDYILSKLSIYTEDISVQSPEIVRLKHVQHLKYAIEAKLKKTVCYLLVLFDLHPTPALCGVPKVEAMKYIEANEGFSRGYYGGGVGYIGINQCEIAVQIRMGLLRGDKVQLFGGAGITRDSIPSIELEEIKQKLQFGEID